MNRVTEARSPERRSVEGPPHGSRGGEAEVPEAAPFRILMMLHMPWSKELGAPRVAMELAEQWQARGAQVDHFALEDAFPRQFPLLKFFQWALFPYAALAHLRRHAPEYHVIVAEQGCVPWSKARLRFPGLLVSRSSGLYHFHHAFLEEEKARRRASGQREGSLAGNLMRALAHWAEDGLRRTERCFAVADRILLLNDDERDYVEGPLGFRGKAMVAPNGLPRERMARFREQAAPAETRQAGPTVAFIGYWCPLKGSEQFGELARRVRQRCPSARFKLLGTGIGEEEVLRAFHPDDRHQITVVPRFGAEELPALLSDATVGVLPSGMEGFGLAVLEMLAAGLPTFAYDVPGPRVMLGRCRERHLVKRDDIPALAEALSGALTAPPAEYRRLREESYAVAGEFVWEEIAVRILTEFRQAHAALHPAPRPERAGTLEPASR